MQTMETWTGRVCDRVTRHFQAQMSEQFCKLRDEAAHPPPPESDSLCLGGAQRQWRRFQRRCVLTCCDELGPWLKSALWCL